MGILVVERNNQKVINILLMGCKVINGQFRNARSVFEGSVFSAKRVDSSLDRRPNSQYNRVLSVKLQVNLEK